jgi:hypothetical protein
MKQIRTTKSTCRRLTYSLSVCALIVTLGAGSGVAADEGPKATVVFDHALPNVPGKSIKACSSNMLPAVRRQATCTRSLLSSTQRFSKEHPNFGE